MKISEMDSGGNWNICAEIIAGNVETSKDYIFYK